LNFQWKLLADLTLVHQGHDDMSGFLIGLLLGSKKFIMGTSKVANTWAMRATEYVHHLNAEHVQICAVESIKLLLPTAQFHELSAHT